MRQKRQMDKLRFLTESRNGKESVIEKLIHKDNSSSNRISCRIAEKSDIKSMMDVCFIRQKWMSERGLGCVVFKETREYYRQKIREHKMMVCVQDDKVLGFCIVSKQDLAEHWPTSLKDGYDGVYVFDCMSLPDTGQEVLRLLLDHIMKTLQTDIRLDMEISNDRLESFYKDELGFNVIAKSKHEGMSYLLMEKTYTDVSESFTRKISSRKETDLTSNPSFDFDDGVYILHDTLGVKSVEGWNPRNNYGVVGILVVEGEHKIVVALEDAPKTLTWSVAKNRGLINRSMDFDEARTDFDGEQHCEILNYNIAGHPAARYCLRYKKGKRKWHLPSSGELLMVYNHLEDVQTALGVVRGQVFETIWSADYCCEPIYWSSTEYNQNFAWGVIFKNQEDSDNAVLDFFNCKDSENLFVRPVSKFNLSPIKESFIKKTKKSSNKDLVDIADKLASTNYDYNEENFIRKLRKETEQYYKSEFYKVYHYPLDYRHNGDIWPADEDGFYNMYMESTYWAERNEEVDFEGYCNDVSNNYAEPADVGVFVFGYGKDCVAYGEYNEYAKTHQLTESFTAKTKNKNNKDLQDKSDNVFNLDTLLREYVKSHCRPGSHNFDFYFTEENRPAFSDTEDFDIELFIKDFIILHGRSYRTDNRKYSHNLYLEDYRKEFFPFLGFDPYFVIVSDNYQNSQDNPIRKKIVDDKGNEIPYEIYPGEVLVSYSDSNIVGWIPLRILPKEYKKKIYQTMKVLEKYLLESFTRKTKQKSAEDIKQKADEFFLENLVKEIVLENDSFVKNAIQTRTFGRRQPNCTHVLKNLRVKPTKDPTLSPYAINGMVVLDESFYFKPEKYDISPLLAETLKKKSMKELYNSDSIIVLNRIYTMEYRGKELLRTEFNILRYNERYGRYSDVMNPQNVYFEFTDLPKELRLDIYRFLRKKFTEK